MKKLEESSVPVWCELWVWRCRTFRGCQHTSVLNILKLNNKRMLRIGLFSIPIIPNTYREWAIDHRRNICANKFIECQDSTERSFEVSHHNRPWPSAEYQVLPFSRNKFTKSAKSSEIIHVIFMLSVLSIGLSVYSTCMVLFERRTLILLIEFSDSQLTNQKMEARIIALWS